MTPPDDDRPDAPDHELYDETPPRSIFAATWFRAVLVLLIVGAVGAVAVPYILDAMNPPTKASVAARSAPAPAVTPAPVPVTPVAPPERMPDKTAIPDKAPADKPVTAMPATPRKPLDKPLAAEKPAPAAPPALVEKPAAPDKKDTRTAATAPKKSAPATPKRAATAAATRSAPTATGGEWWVQVGAFRDHDTAKKVAAKLREQNYKVEESVRTDGAAKAAAAPEKSAPAASAAAPAGADQYDVLVSGMSAADLNKRLAAKGLAAEATAGGAVIKPSLPLRDAVALSKDLAVEGFKVQVRRSGGPAPEPAPRTASDRPAEPPAAAAGEALYRVRVGAFPDRATATATLKELESKGFTPFIARGGQ